MSTQQQGLGAYAQAHDPDSDTTGPANVVLIPLDRVEDYEDSSRTNYDKAKLEQLAQSIKEDGLINPLTVRPHPRGDGYECIAGHRRLRACRMIGLQEVPCLVRTDLDDESVSIAHTVENLHRDDLDPYEEARAYQAALDRGLTKTELIERLDISWDRLRSRLHLLELPEDLAQRVGDDGFTLEKAEVLYGLRDHPEIQDVGAELVNKVDGRGRPITTAQFRRQIARKAHHEDLAVWYDRIKWEVSRFEEYDETVREDVSELDQVVLGTGDDSYTLIPDVDALAARLQEAEKRKQEELEQRDEPTEAERRRKRLEREREEDIQALVRSKILDEYAASLEDEDLLAEHGPRLVACSLFDHTWWRDHRRQWLADALDLPRDDVDDLFEEHEWREELDGEAVQAFVDDLATAGRLGELVAALALLSMGTNPSEGTVYDGLQEPWLDADRDAIQAEAEEQVMSVDERLEALEEEE